MMIKKIIKDILNIVIITATIMTSCFNEVFALSDRAKETQYSVEMRENGEKVFKSSIGDNLNILPYISEEKGGDLSMEFSNPFCLGYTAVFMVFLYAGSGLTKLVATVSLIIAVAVIYSIASLKYSKYEICGANWLTWGSYEDLDASTLKNYRKHYPVMDSFGGSRKFDVDRCNADFSKCNDLTYPYYGKLIDNDFVGERTYLTINDRAFREKVYGGLEVPNEDCEDPREEAKEYDVNVKRNKTNSKMPQLYYMRGYEKGNYACDRFLMYKSVDNDEFDKAYKCCVKASNSVCVQEKSEKYKPVSGTVFCNVDKKTCSINGIMLEVFSGNDGNPGKYCLKTYSLCPYNFNIEHGTEKTKLFKSEINYSDKDNIEVNDECYDSDNDETLSCQGKISNFYQYNRHCTIVEEYNDVPTIDHSEYSLYMDKSCINFVGSSHNNKHEFYKSYNGYERIFNIYNSFTAPAAECITESLKNFLYNKAGHTVCNNVDYTDTEIPNDKEECPNRGVYIAKGQNLNDIGVSSPTVKLLSRIHGIIKLVLILMIALYGFNVLIQSEKLDRKGMVMLLIKVVLVVSFSASDWWYQQLFNFTYGLSNTMSNMMNKFAFDTTIYTTKNQYSDELSNEESYIKYDGCYFGDMSSLRTSDGSFVYLANNYSEYPINRRYISFFDTIDCKINKYLGVGIGINAPNIMKILAISLIWPFTLGIYLAVATLLLAFFAINFAIKAVYIFVMSSIAMAIMLYISPIIIPCILFKKTKGMFDKWLKNLISFALQPMILFLYTSIAITIMDKYTLGEAIFVGKGTPRELVCGYTCVNENGLIIDYEQSRGKDVYQKFYNNCTGGDSASYNKVIDLKRNSMLCFLNNITSSNWGIFQAFGIFLPKLVDFFLSDFISFLRVGFLFFILSSVLDTIPGVISTLTGGTSLPGADKGDPSKIYEKATGIFKTLNRAHKGIVKKFGGKAIGGIQGLGKKFSKDKDEKRKDVGVSNIFNEDDNK